MKNSLIKRGVLAAVVLAGACGASWGADKVVDVTEAGVKGDGTTLNTAALQAAIDKLAESGGGTLKFPAGKYVTGTVQLKSNITLRVEEGATILGSANPADYRNLDPFTDGVGSKLGHALIVAVEADRVGVEGPGTIDGQGAALRRAQNPFTMRPFLIRWVRCTNVTVKDAHLTNPGAWTLNFFKTKGATIEGLTIRTRTQGLANNDGINIDSSEGFRIKNCDVDSGDDALVIKATSAGNPSRDIEATNCKLATKTNAIKLGTESIGGFSDITVSHCEVRNTGMAGIALYEVDGADLTRVRISDVTMDGVQAGICLRLGARMKTFREGDAAKPGPGTLKDVTIENVTAKNVRVIGMLINGVPGHGVENVTFSNIHLEVPGGGTAQQAAVQLAEKENAYPEYNMFGNTMPAYGMYVRHTKGITFKDVSTVALKADARPAAVFIDAVDTRPANFMPQTQPTAPATRP